MGLVGFDIGNENCVIGVAKLGGIDVLLNEESNRETPAVVSFGEKQRYLGLAGAASATMNPKSTISQVKRLIGVNFKEQEDLNLLPFETSEGPDGGVMIHVQYLNETHSFTPVQIMAMLFAHLKQMSKKSLDMAVTDCVISIPSYFTDLQRRAYLDAAEIAGLHPLRLMHDCTATALGYGIYKTDFHSKDPIHVVFVDIGHCDTQVTVASFQPRHMKILSHSFDRNLGGRNFDEVLFKHFAMQFKTQYNIDIYSNTRASVRLRVACEKLKKVLSANPEAPLNIECLMDEKDVKGFIKRDEFENLSSHLLERISVPCDKAMADSGVSLDMIHSVELVGSGSRIPAVKKILAYQFGMEPRRTLNASECVARGCALQCAMLNPTFRVKEYEVQDSFPYSIGFSSDGQSSSILFRKGCPVPSEKVLAFSRSHTFYMEAFYADQNELPSGVSPKISDYKIGPFQVSDAENMVKVKVRAQLNLHGIASIGSASLIEDHSDNFTVSSKVCQTSETMEANDYVPSGVANGATNFNTAETDTSTNCTADDMRKVTVRRDIPVGERVYGGMTRTELSIAQEKELQLTQQDIKMEQTQEKKNCLESYVYETRTKLFNTYRSFATEAEREGISLNLQQTEDWLYEDGDDESEVVYTEKLADLRKLVHPIERRYEDEEARAQAIKSLKNRIQHYRMSVGSVPTYQADRDYDTVVDEAEQWLLEKIQQQESVPKNIDPVVWSSEIEKKEETLDVMCKHIMMSKASAATSDDKTDEGDKNDDNMSVD